MKKIITIVSYLFIFLLGITTLFPFVYMLLAGLMSYSEVTSIPPTLIPKNFQWANYAEVFEKAPFLRYFINTVIVSLATTVATQTGKNEYEHR